MAAKSLTVEDRMEGVAGAIPSNFYYSSYMTVLTRFRLSRIRKADAEDIGRMVKQENYFEEPALQEILKRIEALNTGNTPEALKACEHVSSLSKEIRRLSPDLRALTLAVHGSVARRSGDIDAAIGKYRQALAIPGLTAAGRGDVLARLAVVYVIIDRAEEALEKIEEALTLVNDPVPVLTVRGWIRMLIRPLSEALDDCIKVMNFCRKAGRKDYSLFSAIINACNILSYEICHADPTVFQLVKSEVEAYRQALPNGGSNYTKVRRQRLMLARASALLMIRGGQDGKAAYALKRSAEGLRENHPDDALDAYTDLMCILAKLGREAEAAQRAQEAASLLERVSYRLNPMGRIALQSASERTTLSHGETMEIKFLIRSRKATG